jgi:hypothetical protein
LFEPGQANRKTSEANASECETGFNIFLKVIIAVWSMLRLTPRAFRRWRREFFAGTLLTLPLTISTDADHAQQMLN